jgi:hypothetical protein
MVREAGPEPAFIDTRALDVGRVAHSEGASNAVRRFLVIPVLDARTAIRAIPPSNRGAADQLLPQRHFFTHPGQKEEAHSC